jgi:Domain of unknown function (DUF4352)
MDSGAGTRRGGSPGARTGGLLLVLAVAVLAVLAYFAFFAGGDGSSLPRTGSTGESVTDGTLEYRVGPPRCGLTSVSRASGIAPEQGQFCSVRVEIHNTANVSRSWSARLTMAGGRSFPQYDYGSALADPDFRRTLRPASRQTETVVFDVTSGAGPQYLLIGVLGSSPARIRL